MLISLISIDWWKAKEKSLEYLIWLVCHLNRKWRYQSTKLPGSENKNVAFKARQIGKPFQCKYFELKCWLAFSGVKVILLEVDWSDDWASIASAFKKFCQFKEKHMVAASVKTYTRASFHC
jgi:hypothetical protein